MLRNLSILILTVWLFVSPAPAPAPDPCCHSYENLNAVLWMQTSVEYKAAARQTYRLAQSAMLHALSERNWTAALEQTGSFSNLPPAVILDLDETVLDNSVYEARNVIAKAGYDEKTWNAWVDERAAGLVPGALEFIQFAKSKNVTPIYITNRVCDPSNAQDPTVEVLTNLKIPIATDGGLLCAKTSSESDKTQRRADTAAKYRILLQFGDQLGDFLQIPQDSANLAGREKLYESHKDWWGERWFQLPNPMYGSWEGAVGYCLLDKVPQIRH